MLYDVVLTIPNVTADSKEEAERVARENATQPDRGFAKVTELE